MGFGGVSLWTSGRPEGTMVTSLPGGKEYLTLFCHSAEVSDGSCGLLLVKSFLILCKHMIVNIYGVWCLWNLLRGKKNSDFYFIALSLSLSQFYAYRENEGTR